MTCLIKHFDKWVVACVFPCCRLGNLLACVPKQKLLDTARPGDCAHFVAELTPTGTVSNYVRFLALTKNIIVNKMSLPPPPSKMRDSEVQNIRKLLVPAPHPINVMPWKELKFGNSVLRVYNLLVSKLHTCVTGRRPFCELIQ